MIIRCVCDVGTGQCVRDAEFSPEGKLFATSCLDTTVKLWDADCGRIRQPHAIP